MSVLYIVLPIALLLALVAVLLFLWAVRSGQLDDLETPAMRMLHEDEEHRRTAPDEAEAAEAEETRED